LIIEVEASIVESFLGRIEDPEKSQNTDLNIINDPAFRTIMVIRLKRTELNDRYSNSQNPSFLKYNKPINAIIHQFSGRVVKQNEDYLLSSFESVSKAILCALAVQTECDNLAAQNDDRNIELKIGLSAGAPVTEKEALFEDTIKLAERMCNNINAKIAISSEVKDLYKSENLNVFTNADRIFALSSSDEKFITDLLDYTEKSWQNTELKVDDFGVHLGFSKSQLYRKMILLTGKSPNAFLKEYRLNKALNRLNKQTDNISEIAFDTGFSSPSYFSKCFQKRYGRTPSEYLQTKEA
jgi:AraC-like DNA-binding protein